MSVNNNIIQMQPWTWLLIKLNYCRGFHFFVRMDGGLTVSGLAIPLFTDRSLQIYFFGEQCVFGGKFLAAIFFLLFFALFDEGVGANEVLPYPCPNPPSFRTGEQFVLPIFINKFVDLLPVRWWPLIARTSFLADGVVKLGTALTRCGWRTRWFARCEWVVHHYNFRGMNANPLNERRCTKYKTFI